MIIMERNLFRFGESSLALVVPKKWTEKNSLKPSSTLYISENESCELVLASKGIRNAEKEIVVSNDMTSGMVSRWIELHYLHGTSKLVVNFHDNMSSRAVKEIESRISQNCPGFVATEQSGKHMVIEDLMGTSEQSLDKIIGRLRSLIQFEFREVLEGDPRNIEGIEELVNKFYMIGTRYVFVTQPKDQLVYFRLLERIEQISDNMNDISIECKTKHKKIFAELSEMLYVGFAGFGGDMKAVGRAASIRKAIKERVAKTKMDKFDAFCLTDTANHMANIAEFGLRV